MGAAVQGWRKGTRCRSEWGWAEDRTRGHRTPRSLGVDCWLPDPSPHKSCLPQLCVLRAHTAAPRVCFCLLDDWLFGSGSRAGLGAVEIAESGIPHLHQHSQATARWGLRVTCGLTQHRRRCGHRCREAVCTGDSPADRVQVVSARLCVPACAPTTYLSAVYGEDAASEGPQRGRLRLLRLLPQDGPHGGLYTMDTLSPGPEAGCPRCRDHQCLLRTLFQASAHCVFMWRKGQRVPGAPLEGPWFPLQGSDPGRHDPCGPTC